VNLSSVIFFVENKKNIIINGFIDRKEAQKKYPFHSVGIFLEKIPYVIL